VLARFELQIQLCGTITNVSREFAERAAHGCDDIIQAFKARDTPRAAFLVGAQIGHVQEVILARFTNEIASRKKPGRLSASSRLLKSPDG
jgi:DNA-binding GntR family transcriptional regulator